MPRDHTILTEHRNGDGQQITEKTVDFEDGTSATFSAAPGEPFEYDGEHAPPAEFIEALEAHLDEGGVADDLLGDVSGHPGETESETLDGSE